MTHVSCESCGRFEQVCGQVPPTAAAAVVEYPQPRRVNSETSLSLLHALHDKGTNELKMFVFSRIFGPLFRFDG